MEHLVKEMDRKAFSNRIEDLVKDRPMPYMDAILKCTEDLGIEVESAAKLLNKNIREKLEVEAQDLNLVQKSARLPI